MKVQLSGTTDGHEWAGFPKFVSGGASDIALQVEDIVVGVLAGDHSEAAAWIRDDLRSEFLMLGSVLDTGGIYFEHSVDADEGNAPWSFVVRVV